MKKKNISIDGVKLSNKKILFVYNSEKAGADKLAERLLKAVQNQGAQGKVMSGLDLVFSNFEKADLCCVIGGDGTILSCIAGAVKYDVPILAINLGTLGFMATLTEKIQDEQFVDILSGNCDIDSRLVLETKINDKTFYALNEFAIKSSEQTVISASVHANSEFVALFTGDGLILSTPTGSTAYNLSAGGPLIHPNAKAFTLTTICSHTLSNRSIVFDDSTEIEVVCDKPSVLLYDGFACEEWNGKSPVKIKSSERRVKFLRTRDYSHFTILRTKLGWGENPRESKNNI